MALTPFYSSITMQWTLSHSQVELKCMIVGPNDSMVPYHNILHPLRVLPFQSIFCCFN